MKLLVEEFSADVNSMKTDGVSPLLAATYSNHKNTARYLLLLVRTYFTKTSRATTRLPPRGKVVTRHWLASWCAPPNRD